MEIEGRRETEGGLLNYRRTCPKEEKKEKALRYNKKAAKAGGVFRGQSSAMARSCHFSFLMTGDPRAATALLLQNDRGTKK